MQITATELANNAAMNIDALLTSPDSLRLSNEEYEDLLKAEERLFAIRERLATAEKRVA